MTFKRLLLAGVFCTLAISTAHAGAELGILDIARDPSGPALSIGGTVLVRVRVRNSSQNESARVAAGALLLRNKTVIGPPATIAGGAVATLVVRVPIEGRKVRNDQFTTRVFIANAAVATTAPMLLQLWKDRNLVDNSRNWSLRLPASHVFDVTVRLTKLVSLCEVQIPERLSGRASTALLHVSATIVRKGRLPRGATQRVDSFPPTCPTTLYARYTPNASWPADRTDKKILKKDQPTSLGRLTFRATGVRDNCALALDIGLSDTSREFGKTEVGKLELLVDTRANVRKTFRAPALKSCPVPFDLEVEVTSAVSGADLQ